MNDQHTDCLNCGTRLRGQYCGHCGQRSRSRLISIWQLLKEAFGDLFEIDSRLWRTLLPLFARPGQLTKDYLEGRRARYMPPFRTYLVLSVIFLVIAFFDPKEDLSLFFEPEPEPTAEQIAEDQADAQTAAEAHDELEQELVELGKDSSLSQEIIDEIIDDDDEINVRIGAGDGSGSDGFFENCEEATITDDDSDMPEWLKKRLTDERMRQICERNKARGVENFGDALIDNIPIGLVVLLPFLAFALKLLYPLSRRYFVEHLLFFVHFHAFFFMMLTLQVIFSRLASAISLWKSVTALILVIASLYIPVYLYKAMRHVYGQGHIITLFKYLMLLVAYFSGVVTTMLVMLILVVMSA